MTEADVFENLIRRNRDDGDEYGTSWMPRQNDEHPNPLVGVIAGYDQGTTRAGDAVWIAKVRDRGGQVWSVWLFGTVLHGEFMKKRPEPGEPIVLSYVGMSQNPKPGQNPAALYRLTLNRELALPPIAPQLPPGNGANGDSSVTADQEVVEDAEVVEPGRNDDDIPF